MYEEYKEHLWLAIKHAPAKDYTAHALIAIALLLEQANFIKGNY